MSTFSVKILSFQDLVYEANALSVTIPSQQGYLTVMKDHIPLAGQLEKGKLHVQLEEQSHPNKVDMKAVTFDVDEGFYEMTEEGCVIYLMQSLATLNTLTH